jgi:hypothetical protein
MVVGKLVVRRGICESRFFLKPGDRFDATVAANTSRSSSSDRSEDGKSSESRSRRSSSEGIKDSASSESSRYCRSCQPIYNALRKTRLTL